MWYSEQLGCDKLSPASNLYIGQLVYFDEQAEESHSPGVRGCKDFAVDDRAEDVTDEGNREEEVLLLLVGARYLALVQRLYHQTLQVQVLQEKG